jgi:hypothetical protein
MTDDTPSEQSRVPNAGTLAAMDELKQGKGVRFVSVADLMADLNAKEGE